MTPLFGPGWGNYAIRGIAEVSTPEPVSLWPQTPGWYLLALALLLFAGYRAWRRLRHWRRNRYRREALSALLALRERAAAGDHAALRELAPLLKATALAAAPREAIAGADEETWAAQLQTMAPESPPVPAGEIHRLAYAPLSRMDSGDFAGIFSALEQWIIEHRGPGD